MSAAELPDGVGRTALGVALVRAEESRRPDRLFDDPYAAAFVAAVPGAFDAETRAAEEDPGGTAAWGAAFWSGAVIRTRFFDDHLLAAAADGLDQVVLLAAGLDTRAYRLDWPPGVHLWEVDLPDVLAFKERVLADQGATPRCTRTALRADLRGNWAEALTDAGLHPRRPTAWLAEGLMIYLSPDEAAALLTDVGGLSAPGSRLTFETGGVAGDPMREQARVSPGMQRYARLWRGGLPDAADWLRDHGWTTGTRDRAEVAAGYDRSLPEGSTGGFVVATRD